MSREQFKTSGQNEQAPGEIGPDRSGSEGSSEIDPRESLQNRMIVYERLLEKKRVAHESIIKNARDQGTHEDIISRMQEIHRKDIGEIESNLEKIRLELDGRADRLAA